MNMTTTGETTALAVSTASAGALLMNDASMDRLERLANMMANGKTTVPQHLRSSPGDCFAICLQSMQWGMNPFAVAQKTHLVNGTLGYEAQLVAAVINNSGLVKDRFQFEWFGPWEKVIGKFIIKRGDKGEYRQPGWTMEDEVGCGIKVWATLRGESQPRVLELLLAQARVRNSTLWADDPKQQLAYLAQKRWSRLHAPDVILGVYTADELHEPGERFMGEAQVVNAQPAAPTEYPQADFDANLNKWAKLVASGRKSFDDIVNTVEAKAPLSDDQKNSLAEAIKTLQANTVDATPKAEASQPSPPEVGSTQLEERLRNAPTLDSLFEAADLISSAPEEAHEDLNNAFAARQAELGG